MHNCNAQVHVLTVAGAMQISIPSRAELATFLHRKLTPRAVDEYDNLLDVRQGLNVSIKAFPSSIWNANRDLVAQIAASFLASEMAAQHHREPQLERLL